MRRLRRIVTAPPRVLWAARRELLVGLALIGGWLLMVWAAAELLTKWIWPLGLGLLLLGLGGFELFWQIARKGLYFLTRDDTE